MLQEPIPGGSGTALAERQTAEYDPIEDALRQMAEEPQGGVASADRPDVGKRIGFLLSRLKGAMPSMSSIPKPHLEMSHISGPDLSGAKEKAGQLAAGVREKASNLSGARERAEQLVAGVREKMSEMHMPNTSVREGLSKAGEVIDKTPVAGFLKRSVESYLNKFDPRGKDKKAWALGIAAGAGSVIAAAEFGATLGFSPALRGLAVFAILNTSDFLYSRLHNAYIARATGSSMVRAAGSFLGVGQDPKTADFRKQVIGLEKTVAAKGLKGQAFIDAYKEELSNLRRQSLDGSDPSIINYTGLSEGQVNKLLKLGTDYAVVNSTAKSLAAGMSAGSFMGAMGELGVRTFLKGSVVGALSENYTAPQVQMPEVTLPQMPQVEMPNVELPHLGMPHVDFPSVPHAPDSLPDLTDKIHGIEATPEYQTGIAAEVGKYLPVRDDIVNEALKVKGILPAEIDTASFDAGKEAALHVMEGKGNEIFDSALKEALSADPSAGIAKATEIAQNAYADWLSSADTHAQIAEAAHNAIADNLRVEEIMADKVSNVLLANPDWYNEITIQPGDTMWDLLHLTGTASDGPIMGAAYVANPDLFNEGWADAVRLRPDLLSEAHFPLSVSEAPIVAAKAEAGDEEANKIFYSVMRNIRAGSEFKRVAANVSREVLKRVA